MRHFYILKTNIVIIILFFLLYTLGISLLYFYDFFINFSNVYYSFFFIVFLIPFYFFRFVVKLEFLHLYSLFFLTSIVFLGGRFIGTLIDPTLNTFDLDFFVKTRLDSFYKQKVFYLIMLGFLSLELGFYLSSLLNRKSNVNKKLEIKLHKYFFWLIIFLALVLEFYKGITSLFTVLQGGYHALYADQVENYSFKFGLISKLLSGLAIVLVCMQPNKRVRNFVFYTLLLISFLELIAGSRGGFITYILFMMWYFNKYGENKISVVKLVILMLSILIFLTSIFSLLTFRYVDENNNGLIASVGNFFYGQGITLMVFAESIKIDSYPIIPYFQNFIPGFSYIYSIFNGPIYSYDNNFGYYLGYTLNSTMHEQGYGLGWSFFGDAYRYSFGNYFLYSVFIVIFSCFINFIIIMANNHNYYRFILLFIAQTLLFLPRSVLSTFFPLIIYASILYILVKVLRK